MKLIGFLFENIRDYNLNYDQFDDSTSSPWRKMVRSENEVGAIKYMKKYLKQNIDKLNKHQIGLTLWHIGQLYAVINDYRNAIKYMSMNIVRFSIEKNYQMGTISFLKGDLKSLRVYYEQLNDIDSEDNLDVIMLKKLIDNFGKKYDEIYNE